MPIKNIIFGLGNVLISLDDKLENVEAANHVGIHAKQININTLISVVTNEIERIKRKENYEIYQKGGEFAGVLLFAATGVILLSKAGENNKPHTQNPHKK